MTPLRPRLGYASASYAILGAGLLSLAVADIGVAALSPGAELMRLLRGILAPDVWAVQASSVVLTVSFAVLGVGLGACAGFVMALAFARSAAVRVLAAGLRSVHELFWALLLIQVTGISPSTGLLAIAIPYSGIFAKVFSELIEEADLQAERVLPPGTSTLSRFAYGRLPELAAPFRNCRTSCRCVQSRSGFRRR